MDDREHLKWIHERLVKVYGESDYVDYMHALRCVISRTAPGDKVNTFGASDDMLTEIRARQHGTTPGDYCPLPGVEQHRGDGYWRDK